MQSLSAIADPTRRRIVELLAKRERTAGELVAEFDLSAPAISQHLKVLREAGLVTVRAEGQSRVQVLNPDGLDELAAGRNTSTPSNANSARRTPKPRKRNHKATRSIRRPTSPPDRGRATTRLARARTQFLQPSPSHPP
jgi:DNA-binding transcriptional ArsR family regulator